MKEQTVNGLGNRMDDFEFEIVSEPEEEEIETDDYEAQLEAKADAVLAEIYRS